MLYASIRSNRDENMHPDDLWLSLCRYVNLQPHQQAVVPLVSVNTAVFLVWNIATPLAGRYPWMLRFMNRNFVHYVLDSRLFTMVTSSFSHQSLMHFLFNQIAMWSVGSLGIQAALETREALRQRQQPQISRSVTSRPHAPVEVDFRYQTFAAFIFCAVGGAAASRLFRRAAFRTWSSSAAPSKRMQSPALSPSKSPPVVNLAAGALGASGGVYGLFAITALATEEPLRIG